MRKIAEIRITPSGALVLRPKEDLSPEDIEKIQAKFPNDRISMWKPGGDW